MKVFQIALLIAVAAGIKLTDTTATTTTTTAADTTASTTATPVVVTDAMLEQMAKDEGFDLKKLPVGGKVAKDLIDGAAEVGITVDTNGDGKVSKKELRKALSAYLTAHPDDMPGMEEGGCDGATDSTAATDSSAATTATTA